MTVAAVRKQEPAGRAVGSSPRRGIGGRGITCFMLVDAGSTTAPVGNDHCAGSGPGGHGRPEMVAAQEQIHRMRAGRGGRDEDPHHRPGRAQQDKDEMATRHGAWGGAAVGAVVVGILFPPAIIGTAIVGAAVGGVGGHLWRGMSRADVMEFGDIIDEGQAALVIVGESTVEQAVDKA